MNENINLLVMNKLKMDITHNLIVIIFIMIISYLLLKVVLSRNVLNNNSMFRLNSEKIYAIIKIFAEFIYVIAISLSAAMVFLLLQKDSNSSLIININNPSILGFIILVLISFPFKVIFTGRNKLFNVIDVIIIIVSLLFIVWGMVVSSLSYFNFLINA